MAKVIRTAKLSAQPYRLRVRADGQEAPVEGEGAPEGVSAGAPGETQESGEEAAEGAEEPVIPDDEGSGEPAGAMAGDEAELAGDLPAREEPEPTFPALQVEALVEERLKEFEARFQQEKEEAYRAGFEDGRSEGLKEGQEQSRSEIERFQSIVEDLTARWVDLMKNTDVGLVDLALAVARRVIGSAVEVRTEPVLEAVQECLGYLQDKSRVVIKVHPDDLETIRRHRKDWLESLESMEQLIIEGDSGISPGGCVVESPAGDVDAQIEERLEKLRAILIEEIRAGDGDE